MLKLKHLIVFVFCGGLVMCAAPAAIKCPSGTRLLGSLPPDGYEQWCAREGDSDKNIRHGGWIAWHTKTSFHNPVRRMILSTKILEVKARNIKLT